ncbi:MAG TPA: sigma-70 family RNA polymerase sigma factor, partial [Armatimonadota bacterium]|nr:sigma-70 family RNA polymerase sigma factor [Armatimonadota bacterium]
MAPRTFAKAADARWQTRSVAKDRFDSEDALHVSRAQAGDGTAFTALVNKYQTKVYGIVYRMCGAGEDVADLGQEVFVRALQALRKFQYQGEASFRTWLYRIAVNVCINELRRRKRRRKVEGASLDEMVTTETGEVERNIPDFTTMPHVICEQRETRTIVHELLETMSPQHKAVLTLVDIQGMPYEEASQIIECNLGTLKSRLSRARRAFGQKYRQYLAQCPAAEADAAG